MEWDEFKCFLCTKRGYLTYLKSRTKTADGSLLFVGSGRPGQGFSWPPKFWSCQKLHMALMSDRWSSFLPAYIALTISTISMGWMKINVSCGHDKTLKLDFWPWTPVEKWFPRACCFLERQMWMSNAVESNNLPVSSAVHEIVKPPGLQTLRRSRDIWREDCVSVEAIPFIRGMLH